MPKALIKSEEKKMAYKRLDEQSCRSVNETVAMLIICLCNCLVKVKPDILCF